MSTELPLYRCHKQVRAARIESVADDADPIVLGLSNGALIEVTVKWWSEKHGEVGGYYVVYEDGYASFFPAKAFEDGYTLVQTKKLTIDELQALLESDQDRAITILPNGEIATSEPSDNGPMKPLTMRENLGGEYGPDKK